MEPTNDLVDSTRAPTPSRSGRVLAQETDGELVLLHLDQGTYFALNEVGARVWQLCDGERRVSDIIDAILEEFDAPREVIRADVDELLQDLASDRLIDL